MNKIDLKNNPPNMKCINCAHWKIEEAGCEYWLDRKDSNFMYAKFDDDACGNYDELPMDDIDQEFERLMKIAKEAADYITELKVDRKRLELIKTHASKIYNDAGNHYVFRIALSNPNQTFIEALDAAMKDGA